MKFFIYVYLTVLCKHVQLLSTNFDLISFLSPKNHPKPKGHVIATRITSENPDEV